MCTPGAARAAVAPTTAEPAIKNHAWPRALPRCWAPTPGVSFPAASRYLNGLLSGEAELLVTPAQVRNAVVAFVLPTNETCNGLALPTAIVMLVALSILENISARSSCGVSALTISDVLSSMSKDWLHPPTPTVTLPVTPDGNDHRWSITRSWTPSSLDLNAIP